MFTQCPKIYFQSITIFAVGTTCPNLDDVENGDVMRKIEQTVFHFEDVVRVQCRLGYVVSGTQDTFSDLSCTSDGTWDKDLPTCEGMRNC